MNIEVNFNPTDNEMEQIESWLFAEEKKYNEGFYCNWNIIYKAYKENRVFVLKSNDKSIGFVVWRDNTIYIEIDILEIQRPSRKKGIGKEFYNIISERFREMGFVAVKLFCSPETSEKFWKKMEFIKFPNRGYSDSDLTYYKPLVQTLSNTMEAGDNKVELWDCEPHQIKEQKPKWVWDIKNGELLYPIIVPCNANWNLRWTKDNQIIKNDKIKYFADGINIIEHSPFLYIKWLV